MSEIMHAGMHSSSSFLSSSQAGLVHLHLKQLEHIYGWIRNSGSGSSMVLDELE